MAAANLRLPPMLRLEHELGRNFRAETGARFSALKTRSSDAQKQQSNAIAMPKYTVLIDDDSYCDTTAEQ